MKLQIKIMVFVLMLLSITTYMQARTKDQVKGKKQEGAEILRAATGTYDLQKNKVSRIELFNTNYGMIGHDVQKSLGGGIWPRGSQNQYIYGGGIWFAAKKLTTKGDTTRLVEIGYNPNSGASWFAPGMIEDGDEAQDAFRNKYRIYFSTDFRPDGVPFNPADGPNWPIWDSSPDKLDTLKKDRYLGYYVDDIDSRNKRINPKGPAFISGEDIFTVFKDTDLNRFEGGVGTRRSQGFPLRLQYEQIIYSWGFGDYRDFMFIKYYIINKSKDTLLDCWAASAFDMDIAPTTNTQNGAGNDHTRFYDEDDTLNLAVQWSDGNQGESRKGFGYIGFDFLESPALSTNNYIRHDKKYYSGKEQLGLVSFRNWTIDNDPKDNGDRYDFMSQKNQKDGDNGAGDKRFLMSTGPFNLRPNDTARVVVGLIMANTVKGGDANGTTADLEELIRKDKFAQKVYDDNFRAPIPPDAGPVTWKPLNNAMSISWDSTSEMSYDALEEGLDFLGYRLYRARREDLDSFDVDQRGAPINRGPLGWKQIGQWQMLLPFFKSLVQAGDERDSPYFDSLVSITKIDSFTFTVRRSPNNVTVNNPYGVGVWGNYFRSLPPAQLQNILTGRIDVSRALVTSPPTTIQGLMGLLKDGTATITFPDIEPDTNVRKRIRKEVIAPYMDSITNHRTFIDLGDDDKDGVINEDPNPVKTEKLLNNVDYYYRLLAYDEGDFKQFSPKKVNVGISELNQQKVYPYAAPAGANNSEVQVISVDSGAMGGLYNFKFKVLDQDRFNQLFTNSDNEGHELELEFQPSWGVIAYPAATVAAPNPPRYGLYQRTITLKDKTNGQLLFTGSTFLEPVLCSTPILKLFTENAATYVQADTAQKDSISGQVSTFGVPTDKGKLLRVGSFTTDKTSSGSTCYSSLLDNNAKQTLGFSFDYGIQQQGGLFRLDTLYISNNTSGTKTPISITEGGFRTVAQIDTIFTAAGGLLVYRGFNNGAAQYELEFLEGGDTTLTVATDEAGTTTKQFPVKYLNVRVHNKITYKRLNENGDSVNVTYPKEVAFAQQDPASFNVDLPLTPAMYVPIGSYNLAAFGWMNGRVYEVNGSTTATNGGLARKKQTRGLLGQQNRYYLSSIVGSDTLDFTHTFEVSGGEIVLDYVNKGYRNRLNQIGVRNEDPAFSYGNDFKSGDKIEVDITGGAVGFPLPGAKVTAKVVTSIPKLDQYTDNLLDQVKVVPNPYYITNQAQRSPYDAKIYFTKLPRQCTISIYTVTGELVKKLEHNEFTSPAPDKYAVEIWDLLSTNRQRVASQTLIAKIETPNGASTIQKFSLVVGSFRLIPTD
ncbi:MAG: hypothetical protein JST20_02285 [Bacteroidetes bacterium]|nr:hypothetical protein [Bacteroidota bacterium]